MGRFLAQDPIPTSSSHPAHYRGRSRRSRTLAELRSGELTPAHIPKSSRVRVWEALRKSVDCGAGSAMLRSAS